MRAARVKNVLLGDANEPFDRLARRWLRSRRAHPLLWQVIDLVYGAAGTVGLWLVIGQIAGVVFGSVWALLLILGLVAYLGRRWARPTDDRRK